MSTTDPVTKPQRRQKQDKVKQPAPGTERFKTVVRRLPPNLPEAIFWQSVAAWVSDETVSWKAYYPGKFRTKRTNKEGIPSRAYIAFKNEELVATFSRAYDGHVFRDKAGNESQAVVEFAPFQKVPSDKKKSDARNNTIDKDDDYLSFLDTLKQTKTESVSLEALVAASQPPPPPTTTPLLEALRAEKSAQKDKEAILRNHAHYKEIQVKKEDGKKKTAEAAAGGGAKQTEAPATVGKGAKKAAAAAAAAAKAQAPDAQGTTPKTPAVPPAKPPPPASGRHRPKDKDKDKDRDRDSKDTTHGHGHGRNKGDRDAPAKAASANADSAPPASPGGVGPGPPGPAAPPGRKSRPVIGLGRQFEAALSGTGVGVSGPCAGPVAGGGAGAPSGECKKRDKGEHREGAAEGGGGGKGKHHHRDEVVVPSILQRPEAGPDVVGTVQRSQEPKVEGPSHAAGEGGGAPGGGAASGASNGRGSMRRGRGRGRGRGGG